MDINSILEKHTAWLNGDSESGERADLKGANLKGANLGGADLRSADLRSADLRGADLRGANLGGANLIRANLKRADLWSANLKGADLKGADLWSADLKGADLWSADLRGADLWCADLMDCNGNMTHIKSVFCGQYPVTYTSEILQIGCQQHNIAEWWEFDNKQILEMDGKTALKWWRTWKPILQQIIETAPAEATDA
jgi:hypothetical protein